MIEEIEIQRFRGFESAKVDGCQRVNVIVGENGSGKTALLEAIFLAVGHSPEIATRLHGWRGIEGAVSGTHEQIWHAVFGDLFYNLDMSEEAKISLRGSSERTRSVSIRYSDDPKRLTTSKKTETTEGQSPLVFRWKGPRLPRDIVSRPRLEDGAIKIPPTTGRSEGSFFPANRAPSASETANRFSELSRTMRKSEFMEQFAQHFTDVIDVSVESAAGLAVLYAHIKGIPEKIPLGLASNGMSKLAAILLAIAHHKSGVVIIDEIEAGLYYQRLPKVWESLLSFARRYDAQIFASTHSSECIFAAAQVAEKNPHDFAVLRTVRERGSSQIRRFTGSRFVDAVEEHIEVR